MVADTKANLVRKVEKEETCDSILPSPNQTTTRTFHKDLSGIEFKGVVIVPTKEARNRPLTDA